MTKDRNNDMSSTAGTNTPALNTAPFSGSAKRFARDTRQFSSRRHPLAFLSNRFASNQTGFVFR
jgi:hypothetical protein